MNIITFEPFPKLARLRKAVVITEKLDGTNAQVIITDDGLIAAGSRTRLIYPGKETDNFGFAAWVQDNKEELLKLGPGRHFGEWYGRGIQRGYGLSERRFALFNTVRWGSHNPNTPSCVEVVPVLSPQGTVDTVEWVLDNLRKRGSHAVPGFMNPEGIVVYHTASNTMYKRTFENDEGKWAA
jgi:hypothetical protein